MTSDRIRIATILMPAALLGALTVSASAQAPSKAVVSQIATIQQIKQNFTPAQKKMDSALAFATIGQKSPAMVGAFSTAMPRLATTTTGKVVVDVHGTVSSALLQAIKNAGGDVLYSSTRWNSIHAALPLASVESLAGRSDVVRINKAPLARTSVGSLTTQGYLAHRAKQVVEQQGISGAGVNVGILSDSALPAEVAALKASGDLPPTAFALKGQAGPSNGTNEGTAMMEIVYDMAPGSNQIFATAFTSEASFADNIIALQRAGCKVIADDVSYSDEGVFQDTIVAQAVNQVVANGSTYFSSAGNSGSKLNNDSSAYEADFKDGGPVSGVIGASEDQGRFHDFGNGQLFDQYLAPTGVGVLQWSDPFGGACNDYDLFVTDSTGTVIKGFSAARQDCSPGSIPDEEVDYGNPAAGDRIYVVLFSGVARALHIDSFFGGPLAISTTGNTFGHNAGKNTISVAATYWGSAHKGAVPFTGFANPVEPFSSDGPRKIFYNPNGTEITPGNVLFATNGGTTLQKPDLTAADGVFTKTPGFFLPFFGTSASAPHAAGIGALVVQARPSFTPAQVKTSMIKSALDNMTVGFDINGGWGVAMANGAVNYALTH